MSLKGTDQDIILNRRRDKAFLSEVGAALPESVRDVLRNDYSEDAKAFDEDWAVGVIWEKEDEQARLDLLRRAGVEESAIPKITEKIDGIYETWMKKQADPLLNGFDKASDESAAMDGADDEITLSDINLPRFEGESAEEYQARTDDYNERLAKRRLSARAYKEDEERKAEGQGSDSDQGPDFAGEQEAGQILQFKASTLSKLKIQHHGDYLTFTGKGKRMPRQGRMVDEEQIRGIVMVAVLGEGMRNLQFTKNGFIDKQITQQVKMALSDDPYLQRALDKHGLLGKVQVVSQLTPEPPSYCKGPISRAQHARRFMAQIKDAQRSEGLAMKESIKQARKMGGRQAEEAEEMVAKAIENGERWALPVTKRLQHDFTAAVAGAVGVAGMGVNAVASGASYVSKQVGRLVGSGQSDDSAPPPPAAV